MNRAKYGWRVEKVDQSREQFEACFNMRYPGQSDMLRKSENGNYVYHSVDSQWYMWQASRKELVIELPERLSPEGYHIDEAYLVPDPDGDYLDRDEVIETLTRAGLTVNQS